MIYDVTFSSNGRGYFRFSAEVTNENGRLEIAGVGVDTIPGGTDSVGEMEVIQRQKVEAENASMAISKYRQWQHNGKPVEWLTEIENVKIECGRSCGYVEPYGFVPECGCPIHDPEG